MQIQLDKCDNCGCIKGEREPDATWCLVYPPSDGRISSMLSGKLHYCPVCWRDFVGKVLPKDKPMNLKGEKA